MPQAGERLARVLLAAREITERVIRLADAPGPPRPAMDLLRCALSVSRELDRTLEQGRGLAVGRGGERRVTGLFQARNGLVKDLRRDPMMGQDGIGEDGVS